MPSLRESQERFAAALLGPANPEPRIGIYRRNVFGNWRSALAATYPVVRELVGVPFFDAMADHYADACPSTSGDLNEFGGELARFMRGYPPLGGLDYVADVAALEWALDEAARAADARGSPAGVAQRLAATPISRLTRTRLRLHPAARLVACGHPALRIWEIHQPGYAGAFAADLDAGGEWLLVTRPDRVAAVERIGRAEHAWLETVALGTPLGPAFDAAFALDARFDLIGALGRRVADGTIVGVDAD